LPNNNRDACGEKSGGVYSTDNAINASRCLLLDANSGQVCTPTKSLRESSDGESRPHSLYSDRSHRHSLISCQLPSNIDVEALVVATVTHAGGRLQLPDSGTRLLFSVVVALIKVIRG
jgi:hypothetical protein